MMKTCGICKEELPLTSFNRKGCDHQDMCRACNKVYQKAYRERVTQKSIFQASLRITAHRLSKLRSIADVPPDVNALGLLTGVRGIRKSDPFVVEVREAINSLWDETYNSSEQEIDHIIAYRFYPIINIDRTINVDQLFKVSSYRNLQVLSKYDHAVKSASEMYQQQPVMTLAQRNRLSDIVP